MAWVWAWLLGCPVLAFVLAVAVRAGQHGRSGWPYLVPLLVAGVIAGVICSALAYSTTRHGKRPHETEV